MQFSEQRRAAQITVVYLCVGIAWIYFSDALLWQWYPANEIARLQTLKGWTYVCFTAVLLFLLVRSALLAQRDAQHSLRDADNRLEHLLSATKTILYSLDFSEGDLRTRWASQTVSTVFGYSEDEVLAPDWWLDNLHPEDRERALIAHKRLLVSGSSNHRYRFFSRDRQVYWIHDTARVIRDENGNPVEIVGSWTDISEQQRVDERIQIYSAAFDAIAEGVLITDAQLNIVSANKAATRIFGYTEQELIGQSARILESSRQEAAYFARLSQQLQRAGEWHGEIWNQTKSGELQPQWLSICRLADEAKIAEKYVAIYTDISALKRTEAELQYLAHHDRLTSLPNRLMLQTFLEHSIEQAARTQSRFAVIFIDLVDFKSVNDSLGHVLGDELLHAIAQRLQKRVRAEDMLCRHGGDEFALLMGHLADPEDPACVARALIQVLEEPFRLADDRVIYIEACFGISVYPENGNTVETLLRGASTALLSAKAAGRNTFAFYSHAMGTQVREQLKLESELRQSIARNQLRLNFQPKIDIATDSIIGAEALLRWNHPELGEISPARFIPIAEKSQLIVQLGNWVIREACRQIREWLDAGVRPARVAFNASIMQFSGENDIVTTIRNSLKEFDLPPQVLTLEVTESSLMQNVDIVRTALTRLRELGVKVSLDDFGSGFSNMAYLSSLPLDELKIDISFIRNIGLDAQSDTLVRSMIALAQSLQLRTVAEGVETSQQCRFLQANGCDVMQGFYFSRPLPTDEFLDLLSTGSLTIAAEPLQGGVLHALEDVDERANAAAQRQHQRRQNGQQETK